MIMFIAIILIIILMCLDKDESQKEKESENQVVGYNTMNGRPILRKYVNITGYDTNTGQPLFEYKKPIIGYNPFTGDPMFEGDEIPEVHQQKQPVTEEDKNRLSNTILMITGAILIVIASIIFLATGWETMHGLLKTLILFGVQMIFCLFGYISTNKLNIPKIGKMFNYLTLAFVPIIILSLSFFELVGDYFSIGCEGFIYYLGISLLASDVVYKLYGKSKNDLLSKRASLLVEALAIICFVSEIKIRYISTFALIVHAIIIYILLQGNYLDKKAYGTINFYYSIYLIIVSAFPSLFDENIMTFTNLILLALSFFIRCLDEKEETKKKPLLVLFFISYLLSIRIIEQIDISPYFLYLLSLLPILGLTKVVKTQTMKNNIIKVVGILTIAITTYSIFDSEQTIYYLLTYIVGFIVSILVYALTNKSLYKLWSYVSFSAIFFCICYITEIENVAEYILLVIPILVYAIEMLYEKLKDNTSAIFIIGSLCIEVLCLTEEYTMLIPLALMAIYMLLERKTNLLLIPMFASFLIYSLESDALITTTFSILTLLYVLASISKENFNRYTIFSVLTLLSLCIDLELSAYVTWSLLLVWGIIHYICKPKDNNEVYISAMIFSIFGLYVKCLVDLDSELYANYALGIILVTISMTKGVFKKGEPILLAFIECGVIGGLTLIGSFAIQEPLDGVVYLGILLILSILSYIKEWRSYLYSSIISMIFGVIMLTAEYWKEIPWYVYILVIGLALIVFAMYDEKRKQNKKLQEANMVSQLPTIEQPIIETQSVIEQQISEPIAEILPVQEEIPVPELPMLEETPTDEPQIEEIPIVEEVKVIEKPKLQIVEDTSTKRKQPVQKHDEQIKKTGAKRTNKPNHVHKNKHKSVNK